ncbi:MAG TPA: glycosyl hydrolase family 18 protein [Acidobacteriaceae bacterium]|nr:glycosyl hydrolase family 18 protein [Acidobacteriaceae bacterium]
MPLRSWLACGLVAFALLLQGSPAQGLLRHSRHRSHPVVVGYFPNWGLYYEQPYYVKDLVANHGAELLDQLNYAHASVVGGRCSVGDPRADLNLAYSPENSVDGKADRPDSSFRGYFHQLQELKHRYRHLKILISLEGKAEDFAQGARPENRQAFVASCVNTFLRGEFAPGIHEPGIFDGIDIDWESPQEDEAHDFLALVEEFRRQMNGVRPGLRLSVAVGNVPRMLPGTDFAAIAPFVDQVGIMNYDYAGPWSHITGFIAPLFPIAHDPERSNSIEYSIASYEAAGVPAKKLLMGLPFYGYSWTGVGKTNNGLFQSGRGVRGDRPYRYIRTLNAPFSSYRDERSQAPWLFDGETFWTYEDPVSVRYKVSYATFQHLGGVMIWELSDDTADAEMLGTVYRSLRHPIRSRVFEESASMPAQ